MVVVLSTTTVVITAGVVVVGVFGMNIGFSIYGLQNLTDEQAARSNVQFWSTTLGTIGSCVVMYVLAIGWGKKSGDLFCV